MRRMAGKAALVTGGASGIGRASALALARAGASVCAADIDGAGAEETARLIQAAGGDAFALACDVRQAAEVRALLLQAVARYGHLDAAVNSAGIAGDFHRRLHEADDAMFARVIDVNLNGVWHCMKAELEQMLKQGAGAIVNIASVAGLIGAPKAAAYTASKHAVIGLSKSAALDYARRGIRVNAVCPAYTDTPMVRGAIAADPAMAQIMARAIPMGRLGQPAEIAEAVVWLCSDAASFVTGHALVLDGGLVAI